MPLCDCIIMHHHDVCDCEHSSMHSLHLKGSGICGDLSQTIYRLVEDPAPVLDTFSKMLLQLQQAAIEDIKEAAVAIGLDPFPIIVDKVKSVEGRSGKRGIGQCTSLCFIPVQKYHRTKTTNMIIMHH